jgi:hypothetical protein
MLMTISTLAQQLRKAQHVVIFTGAGASADAIHDDHPLQRAGHSEHPLTSSAISKQAVHVDQNHDAGGRKWRIATFHLR